MARSESAPYPGRDIRIGGSAEMNPHLCGRLTGTRPLSHAGRSGGGAVVAGNLALARVGPVRIYEAHETVDIYPLRI